MIAIGAVRDVLVFRAMAAFHLLQTGKSKDRSEANALFCLALEDARRLRIPEAGQIEQILEQAGMDCDSDA